LENDSDEVKIKVLLPRIIDNLQAFLRDLRVEELQGSHGLYRVREELLVRVNAAADPVKVRDVLFQEMLVQ
jgi:flagellar FliL protein